MIESLRCPVCQAHYGLRPERVHAGHRRAKCFTCGELFGIEEQVRRLLPPPPPPEEMDPDMLPTVAIQVPVRLTPEPGLEISDLPPIEVAPDMPVVEPPLAVPVVSPESPAVEHLEAIAPGDFDLPEPTLDVPDILKAIGEMPVPEPVPSDQPEISFEVLETDEAMIPLPMEELAEHELPPIETTQAFPVPQFDAAPVDETPSLTLGDLDGSDEEILEKTLMMEVLPPPTEMVEDMPAQAAPSNAQDSDGFSSAKDAISRILGGLDAPASQSTPSRLARSRNVDMEATLDALEQTLGGTQIAPPAAAAPTPTPAPAPAPENPRTNPATATTVRISMEDIRSAMESVAPPPVEPTTPARSPLMPERPQASTDRFGSLPKETPTAPPPPDASSQQDLNLLKVQVGTEVYSNVTVEQLTQWIEQGRILEFHQVARQFSDHWIEASKVPALRPVFDRMRRSRIESGAPTSALGDTAQKKGLFGGIFGGGR